MKDTSKTILFFGNERLVSGLKNSSTPALNQLIESGYKIAAIISHHSDSKSRNQRRLEVADIANTYNIPLLTPHKLSDIKDQIKDFGADIAVLCAYGEIVPQSIIDIFPFGIVNIHPSLLPRYRGSTPIESVILNGDKETGVSLIKLSARLDAGAIYDQTKLILSGKENKFEVYEKLSQMGANLLIKNLPNIFIGTIKTQEQNESEATYTQQLKPSDAFLDLTKTTAIEADRKVRAYLGFPKTKLIYKNTQIIITKSHTEKSGTSPLSFPCADGQFLAIDQLIAPSGRTMNSVEFLNGYGASTD